MAASAGIAKSSVSRAVKGRERSEPQTTHGALIQRALDSGIDGIELAGNHVVAVNGIQLSPVMGI
jgi:hypothetical protein